MLDLVVTGWIVSVLALTALLAVVLGCQGALAAVRSWRAARPRRSARLTPQASLP